MKKRLLTILCLAVLAWSAGNSKLHAGTIVVPNGGFETPPADPDLDGDNDYSTGDISPPWNGDNYLRNTNEAFTRPSSFVVGWQSNGPADTEDGSPTDDGKFGLQQPLWHRRQSTLLRANPTRRDRSHRPAEGRLQWQPDRVHEHG